MNLRRIAKPAAAALLAIGFLTATVAPSEAATAPAPTVSTHDTGWGFQ